MLLVDQPFFQVQVLLAAFTQIKPLRVPARISQWCLKSIGMHEL